MAAFLLRRLTQGLVIVFSAVTFTFFLVHAAPGEPFAALLEDPRASNTMRLAQRERFGLDQPLHHQYVVFLGNVARWDFGESFTYRRPVAEVVANAVPRTLLLMGTALLLGFAGGIALGAVQGSRAGGVFDRVTGSLSVIVAALPEFWLAMLALMLFAGYWGVFPVSGMHDPVRASTLTAFGRVLDVGQHLVLPAGTLSLIIAGAVSRFQRAAMIEVQPNDYIRTARAKGVGPRRLVRHHALRNALLPIITLGGLAIPALLGGAVFVESVFGWPGMGSLAVRSVGDRDYPLVLALVVVSSTLVVIGTTLADLLYAACDPRQRHA